MFDDFWPVQDELTNEDIPYILYCTAKVKVKKVINGRRILRKQITPEL